MTKTPKTDARHAADHLEGDLARRLLLDLPDALLVLESDGRIRYLNRQAERLLGRSADEATGRQWTGVMRLVDPDGQGEPLQTLPVPLEAPGFEQPHFLLLRPDGTRRIVQISGVESDAGWPGEAVLLRDCTRVYRRLRQLERQGAYDHLTNLVNRREFEQRLSQVLSRVRRDGSSHALLFMDLDRFKQINDAHGHPVGDAVLKDVAATLRAAVRTRDTLARLGGDEFGLLMEHCHSAQALRTAAGLCRLLQRQRFVWHGEPLRLAVSIGVVEIDADNSDLRSVWSQADTACYRAKRDGGCGVRRYHAESAVPRESAGADTAHGDAAVARSRLDVPRTTRQTAVEPRRRPETATESTADDD